MTTQTATRPIAHNFGLGWIKDTFAGIFHGWRAYHAYRQLSLLSDDQLRDLGLRREQIAHAAFFGRNGLK